MYSKYFEDVNTFVKTEASPQTEIGTDTAATGKDISSWVNYDGISNVSFRHADAAAYPLLVFVRLSRGLL